MIIRKNQIRPRRTEIHFSNAEILLWDTVGLIQVIPAAPPGFAIGLDQVEVQSNIKVDYGNIQANAALSFTSDFGGVFWLQTVGGSVSDILAPGGPVFALSEASNLQALFPPPPATPVLTNGGGNALSYTDFANLSAIGGIYFLFDNAVGDVNAGDPANYVDFVISYHLYNLEKLALS